MEREIQWIVRLRECEWYQLFPKFIWTTKSCYTQFNFESGWVERFGFDYKLTNDGETDRAMDLIHLFKRSLGTIKPRLLYNSNVDWQMNVLFPIVMVFKRAQETTDTPATNKEIFTFGPSFTQLRDVPIDSTTFTRYRFGRGNWRFSLTKKIFRAEPYFSFEAENERWSEDDESTQELDIFFDAIGPVYEVVKLLDFGPLYPPRTIPKPFTTLPLEYDQIKIKYDGTRKLLTVYNGTINAELEIEQFQHFILQFEEVICQKDGRSSTELILTELCMVRNFSTASNLLYGSVKPLNVTGPELFSISIRDSNFWLKHFPDRIGQVYVSKPMPKSSAQLSIPGMPSDGLLAIGRKLYQKIKQHQTIELLHRDGELFALERSLKRLKLKVDTRNLPNGILEFAIMDRYKYLKFERIRNDKREPDCYLKIVQLLKLNFPDIV